MARNSYKLTPDQIAQCKEKLQNVIDEVLKTKKEQTISSHDLYGAYGKSIRRDEYGKTIRKKLLEKDIEIKGNPHTPTGCDKVTLFRTQFLETKLTEDPVRKVSYVPSASHKPDYVSIDDNLRVATDLLEKRNFSQLPVMSNHTQTATIVGYISWQTIGLKKSKGINTDKVADYMEKQCPMIASNAPLVNVISNLEKNDFVIVMSSLNNKASMCGIVTLSDVTTLFFNSNQPFFLLNEIEFQIRMLLADRIALKDVKDIIANQNLDELTLGQLKQILERQNIWGKLQITRIQQQAFLYMLEKVKDVRNKAMHFRPKGLHPDDVKILQDFATELKEIVKEVNLKNRH